MFIFIIGIATGFNFIIILWKFTKNRIVDGFIDLIILAIISILFAGTISGLSVGMIGSAFVSLYLLVKPIGVYK